VLDDFFTALGVVALVGLCAVYATLLYTILV
jgi:hypothetical protein